MHALLLGFALFGADPIEPPELEPLQGTWVHTRLPSAVVVKGNQAAVSAATWVPGERPFARVASPIETELHVNKGDKLYEIDIAFTPPDYLEWKTPKGLKAGELRWPGLFGIEDDVLTLHMALTPDGKRPESLEPPPIVADFVIHKFKRLQEESVREFASLQGVWHGKIPSLRRKGDVSPFYLLVVPGWISVFGSNFRPLGTESGSQPKLSAANPFDIPLAIDLAKKPREFDFGVAGVDKIPGIFELRGDKLMIALGKKRPVDFTGPDLLTLDLDGPEPAALTLQLHPVIAKDFVIPTDRKGLLGEWIVKERYVFRDKADVGARTEEDVWIISEDTLKVESKKTRTTAEFRLKAEDRDFFELHAAESPDTVLKYAAYGFDLAKNQLLVRMSPSKRPLGVNPRSRAGTTLYVLERAPH
jgi:hypothetical protein